MARQIIKSLHQRPVSGDDTGNLLRREHIAPLADAVRTAMTHAIAHASNDFVGAGFAARLETSYYSAHIVISPSEQLPVEMQDGRFGNLKVTGAVDLEPLLRDHNGANLTARLE